MASLTDRQLFTLSGKQGLLDTLPSFVPIGSPSDLGAYLYVDANQSGTLWADAGRSTPASVDGKVAVVDDIVSSGAIRFVQSDVNKQATLREETVGGNTLRYLECPAGGTVEAYVANSIVQGARFPFDIWAAVRPEREDFGETIADGDWILCGNIAATLAQAQTRLSNAFDCNISGPFVRLSQGFRIFSGSVMPAVRQARTSATGSYEFSASAGGLNSSSVIQRAMINSIMGKSTHSSANFTHFKGRLYALAFTPRLDRNIQAPKMCRWLYDKMGCQGLWIHEGDSISVAPNGGYCNTALADLTKRIMFHNSAIGGTRIRQFTGRSFYSNRMLRWVPAGHAKIWSIMDGNSLTDYLSAVGIPLLLDLVIAQRAAGWDKLVGFSILPRSGDGGVFNTRRADWRTAMLGWVGSGILDAMVDCGVDPVVGQDADASDTDKYPDGIHLAPAYYDPNVTQYISPVINALL